MSENKNKNLHLIGRIHSSQGVRGQVFVLLRAQDTPWIKKWKELYLSVNDTADSQIKTYKILKIHPHSKQGKTGWVLNLEGVDNKDLADFLNKMWVWIPKDFITSKKGETIYLHEIKNFSVVDRERGMVGSIVGFSTNGAQDLIQIQTASGDYDVPLVQPFIEKIDFENQKIYMDIPQGLLEDL